MRRKPLAEWRAIRALAEGARPTLDLVAQATRRSTRTLELAAEREGWRLDHAPEEDMAAKVRATAALLMERVEALGRKALEEDAQIDKREIDGLLSLIKGLETVAEITRPQEAGKEKQIRRDEDIASVLRHIHHRIVELAKELAAEMAGGECRQLGR